MFSDTWYEKRLIFKPKFDSCSLEEIMLDK